MPKKRFSPDQIVRLLKQADVLSSQGMTVSEISRELGISDNSYYKWCKEYGGLQVDQLRRLKQLEVENNKLRRAVADLTLDKQILKDAAEGNF